MKAAIIGAGSEALHTIKKAHEHNLSVTALDGNPDAEGLKEAERAIVVDISDEKATIEALKREKPDFVLTAPIGRYLTTTGAVNDALGLPGISREMAVVCTDKLKFHETLHKKGLRNCYCAPLADMTESERAMLPFCQTILKPRFGSGSRGIYMLPDIKETRPGELIPLKEREDYLAEEYIEGEEYGVDGAVTEDGFHMILLRKKENTPLPARQAVAYYSVPPSEGFRQRVKNHMGRAVDALGLKDCLLHADVIKTKDEPFIIELSARPSGHNLHNLFTPLCTGVDMAEEFIKCRMGLPYCFEPQDTKTMMIHYFDMEGRVKHVPDRERAERAISAKLCAWECHLEEGEKLQPVSDGHSVMGRGYFVIEGSSSLQLHESADIIKSLFIE